VSPPSRAARSIQRQGSAGLALAFIFTLGIDAPVPTPSVSMA
jgi:hypothetical protein